MMKPQPRRLTIKQTATRFNKKPETTVSATTVTTASPEVKPSVEKPVPTQPVKLETTNRCHLFCDSVSINSIKLSAIILHPAGNRSHIIICVIAFR